MKLDLVQAFPLSDRNADIHSCTVHLRGAVATEQQPEWKGASMPALKARFLGSGLMRLCPTRAFAIRPTAPRGATGKK